MRHRKPKALIAGLLFLIFIFDMITPQAIAQTTPEEHPHIYFVIGIGMYLEGGTWPMYDEICPLLFIRFGKPQGPYILTPYTGERIDFLQGDTFIGYYPLLNPIQIGFVCGIWIDR
jgi:hypothetical protein